MMVVNETKTIVGHTRGSPNGDWGIKGTTLYVPGL